MKILALLVFLPLAAFAQHTATTTVQIHPAIIGIVPGEKDPLRSINAFRGEFETISSQRTLEEAAKLLQPENKLKGEPLNDLVTELKKSLATETVRGTDLINISVTHDSKAEAIRRADAIAQAFITRHKEAETNRAKRALAALDEELVAQSELVQAARKELTVLIQKHGIPYFEAQGKAIGPEKLKESLAALKTAQPSEKLAVAASLEIPDNPVPQLYQDYLRKLEQLDFLREGSLGPKHPDVVAARKALDHARQKVKQATAKLPALIQAKLKKLAKMDSIEVSLLQNQYNQAKEAYEQTRAMLREMKIRQQEARVLLKMPRDPVTIHQKAR